MKEVIVKINEFVCPSYTYGMFGFHYNQEVVPYELGDHHGSIYHLNMGIVEALAADFPDYVVAFDRKTEKVSEWGPETEIRLCKLMMDGKLKLPRKGESGEDVLVRFIWEGSIWEPKTRPTRRKK